MQYIFEIARAAKDHSLKEKIRQPLKFSSYFLTKSSLEDNHAKKRIKQLILMNFTINKNLNLSAKN